MSDTYGSQQVASAAPMGGTLADLVSTQKGGVQNLSVLAQTIMSALPAGLASAFLNNFAPAIASGSSSPVATPVNSLGTTGASVIGSSSVRFGILFHNPSSTVAVYVYPSLASPAPTLASAGGAFLILPGGTLPLMPPNYRNNNAAFSAFAGTGTNNPLTIWEFR